MFKGPRLILTLCLMVAIIILPPRAGIALESSALTILSPGEGSEATSPIILSAEMQANPGGLIRVALVNREGQEISRKLMRADGEKGLKGTTFTTELPFEIPTDQSKALITLSTLNSAYQITATRSVEVLLKSGGSPSIQSQTNTRPWLEIFYPQPLETIVDGTLLIVGSVTPRSENPIIFELITEQNHVVGSAQLSVTTPNQPIDFEIPLKYSVEPPSVDARLVICQRQQPYGVIAFLDSFSLTLSP